MVDKAAAAAAAAVTVGRTGEVRYCLSSSAFDLGLEAAMLGPGSASGYRHEVSIRASG
jgi:hypothetical protein